MEKSESYEFRDTVLKGRSEKTTDSAQVLRVNKMNFKFPWENDEGTLYRAGRKGFFYDKLFNGRNLTYADPNLKKHSSVGLYFW